MAGLNDTAKNLMLDALTDPTAIDFASAHTADPGATGTNEHTDGGAGYTREAITYAAAATGSVSHNGTDPVFDIDGATSVTHIGFWDSVTVGTFYGSATVTTEAFGGDGTYTLTTSTISLT